MPNKTQIFEKMISAIKRSVDTHTRSELYDLYEIITDNGWDKEFDAYYKERITQC